MDATLTHTHFMHNPNMMYNPTPSPPQHMMYNHTPSPPQHMMFSNPFTPQQLTPQDEINEYGFVEQVHHGQRSLSSPFVIPQSSGVPMPYVPAMAASIPPHGKIPAVPISPSYNQPRQKAKRTPTACEECRKRKQKCDGETPCQSCKEQKLECQYREVPPSRKDNSMERLAELIGNLTKKVTSLTEQVEGMATTIRTLEERAAMPQCCWQCGSGLRC